MAIDIYFVDEIANVLHSLDVANERHRTTENQVQIDAYQNALIDVGLAFGILPSKKFVVAKTEIHP